MGSGSRGRRYSFEEEKGLVWAYFHVIQEKPHLPARDSNTDFWNCVYETWGEKFPDSKQFVKTASLQFHFRAMRLMASELAFLYDVAIRTGIVPPRSPEAVSVVVQIYSRIFYRKPGRSFVRPQYWELLRMDDNWAELRGGVITRQLHFSLRELEIAQSLAQSESGEYSSQMQLVSSALCDAILPKVRESRTRKQNERGSPIAGLEDSVDVSESSPRNSSTVTPPISPKVERPDPRETAHFMRRKYDRDHNRYWQPYYYEYGPMGPPPVLTSHPNVRPPVPSAHRPVHPTYATQYPGPPPPGRPMPPPAPSEQTRPSHPAKAYAPPAAMQAPPYPPSALPLSYPAGHARAMPPYAPRDYPVARDSFGREVPAVAHIRDSSSSGEPGLRSSASMSTPEAMPSDALSFSTDATDLASDVEPHWHPSMYASPGAREQRQSWSSYDQWSQEYDPYYHQGRRPTAPAGTWSPYARPQYWRSPQTGRPSADWSPSSKPRPSPPGAGWRSSNWNGGYAPTPQWNPYV